MKRLSLLSSILFLTVGLVAQTIKTDLVYLVNEPAERTVKTPVLIMLHGYGSNETDLFDIAKTFNNKIITFALRAPITLEQGSFAWYKLNRESGQSFSYDYKQAEQAALQIKSFISNACKSYNIDSTQVYVLGFSQGAILAYDLAFRYPGNIKGILALSGRIMEESKQVKTNWKEVTKTNFFLAHGTNDAVILPVELSKAETFLKSKQCLHITSNLYDMQHSISGKELNDMRNWLDKSLVIPKKTNSVGTKH